MYNMGMFGGANPMAAMQQRPQMPMQAMQQRPQMPVQASAQQMQGRQQQQQQQQMMQLMQLLRSNPKLMQMLISRMGQGGMLTR